MRQFPVLALIDRHGPWAAPVLAALPTVFALIAAAIGATYLWLPVGLFASGVVYILACSYVELIRLMIDMLLPK